MLASCLDGGYRANHGECPLGETCSDETPYGLRFSGSPISVDDLGDLFDESVHPTAVGGTQQITVYVSDEWGGTSGELSRPFEATNESGNVEIVETSPPDVDIRAVASGTDHIRIVSPTGELYDELLVHAVPVATVRPAPQGESLALAADEPWAFMVAADSDRPRGVLVELLGPDGERLVDTSTEVAIDGQSIENRDSWDLVWIEHVEPGSVEVSVTLGSGMTATTDIPIVDTIDAIAVEGSVPDSVAVDSLATVCMRAELDGVAVAGVDWTYSVNGPIEIDYEGAGLFTGRNCVVVRGTAVGTASIVASAHGLSVQTPLEVVPADTTAAPAQPRLPVLTPGERAAAIHRAEETALGR